MRDSLKYALLSVVFILGYTSLSFELIVLRQLINFVGSNTLITSVIMAFILLFLSLGYYVGSTISIADYPLRIKSFKIITFLTFWYIFACSYIVIGMFFYLLLQIGIESALVQVFCVSAILLPFPSVALGFITAAYGRVIHHFNSDYTGRFMAVDTIGSVTGSLLTTLVLMPMFGVSAAVIFLSFLTSLCLVILSPRKERVLNVIMCALLTTVAVIVSNEKKLLENTNLVVDDAIARVEVYDEDYQNGEPQSKILEINGSLSSKISDNNDLGFFYVQYINRVYIDALPDDRIYNILVLGAGGFAIGRKDLRNNYTYIDVVRQLPEIYNEYLSEEPLSENKKFIAQDAYLFMLKTQQKYDIIVVDVYSAVRSIPSNFVTEDFFELVKKRLATDGLMIANIITSPSFKTKYSQRIDNTLRHVFRNSLNRQIIDPQIFDGTVNVYKNGVANVIYTYYHRSNQDDSIYTIDKNAAVYGNE